MARNSTIRHFCSSAPSPDTGELFFRAEIFRPRWPSSSKGLQSEHRASFAHPWDWPRASALHPDCINGDALVMSTARCSSLAPLRSSRLQSCLVVAEHIEDVQQPSDLEDRLHLR